MMETAMAVGFVSYKQQRQSWYCKTIVLKASIDCQTSVIDKVVVFCIFYKDHFPCN